MIMRRLGGCALLALALAAPCAAGDNYALVVSGASGGEAYAKKYDEWRRALVTSLKSFGYQDDHVLTFSEASRQQVEQAIRNVRTRMTTDDVLFVMLIGHGTGAVGPRGEDAKFNLVGPDMTASEWADELKPAPGRLVFVDTTSAGFPFLRQLAAPGRIVITATDSAAQEFETVFPGFFIKAFTDASADTDKDGRVSSLEAFQYAAANVRIWFDQHNQLPTERAMLEGDEAVARATFLQQRSGPQNEIESAIAALKARRSSMMPAAYDAELERLLIELAKLSAQSRDRP